jgi:flagellar biosynthesis/type III secretory pathway protein FliH
VGAGELELIADARVDRGGCLLETEGDTVDVRLNTVVNQLKESLTSEMKN